MTSTLRQSYEILEEKRYPDGMLTGKSKKDGTMVKIAQVNTYYHYDNDIVSKVVELCISYNKCSSIIHIVDSYLDNNVFSIVMEYFSTVSIIDLIKSVGSSFKNEKIIRIIIKIILNGLVVLHQSEIVHGEVKSQNILVNDQGQIKLGIQKSITK